MWRLVDHPDAALALFKARLQPARSISSEQVARWIDRLGSDAFSDREQAMRELIRLSQVAEPAVRKALAQDVSEERRKRLQQIAAAWATIAPPRGDGLRGVRAVAVLRRIGGAEARRLLERLAAGDDGQYPTREARNALEQMRSSENTHLQR